MKKCKRKFNKQTRLVSFDVTNLFTNIPNSLGLKPVEYCIDKYHELVPSRFHKPFILETVKLVLNNKNFKIKKDSAVSIPTEQLRYPESRIMKHSLVFVTTFNPNINLFPQFGQFLIRCKKYQSKRIPNY